MPMYEYKVVPAPTKGLKAKGVRKPEARFSHALQELMNELSTMGWEYQRAETLPSTERAGLTGSTVEWRNVLVFRRPHPAATPEAKPELLPPPIDEAPGEVKADEAPEMTLDKTAQAPAEPPITAASEIAEEVAVPEVETQTVEAPEEPPLSKVTEAFSTTRNTDKSAT